MQAALEFHRGIFGPAPFSSEYWYLTVETLSLVLQRDRYYFSLYAAGATLALSLVVIAFFGLVRSRIGSDWALAASLGGLMLVPVLASGVYAARVLLAS